MNIALAIFKPAIKRFGTQFAKDFLLSTLLQILQDALRNQFEIPYLGMFHLDFLGLPKISSTGVQAEMKLVSGKRPDPSTTPKKSETPKDTYVPPIKKTPSWFSW